MLAENGKNSQLQPSEETVRSLLESPLGQQLLRSLQKTDGALLKQAATDFLSGDQASAKQRLSVLLEDPSTAKLLRELNRNG